MISFNRARGRGLRRLVDGSRNAFAVAGERQTVTSATKGRRVESTYIAPEIGIHSAVISWATMAEAQAQNKKIKLLIHSIAPVLKKHLDQTMAIQRKLVTWCVQIRQ